LTPGVTSSALKSAANAMAAVAEGEIATRDELESALARLAVAERRAEAAVGLALFTTLFCSQNTS
jgi:hypothetical protein